jgi:hypothetical protein
MRLAFFTSLLPTGTPDTGFEIANVSILDALGREGVAVTAFGFLRSDETGTPPAGSVVLDRIVIENSAASPWQKAMWLMQSYKLDLPVIAAKLGAVKASRLRELIAKHGPFDGYLINSAPVAGAFPWLLQDKPSILITHNVEHRSAEENAASAGGLTALLYRREARLLQRIERKALTDAGFVWCLSEEDRQGFGVDISARSAVMPLLVQGPPTLPDAEPIYDVGLIGTWTWQPNMVGLRWFLDEVVPQLPADLTIAVAGRTPAGFRHKHQQVSLLGRVPDAAAFVASARTIALTSRKGTGIQLKTIETFQTGKPAVATRSSIRGLSMLPVNCLVADDAAGFADAVTKLVRDVRSERTGSADGQAFVAAQTAGMRAAVSQGLAALRR